MAEEKRNRRHGRIDGISCVGSLFIFLLMVVIMGGLLGNSSLILSQELALKSSATATQTNTPTQTATATASSTPLPSQTPTLISTNTATAVPSRTQPPTFTPTWTPTSVPTNTPLPPNTPTQTPTPTPLPTPQGVYSWTLKVPILMYHYISQPPEDADEYRIRLSVDPERFREQMGFLAANGYHTIDFYDLSRAITNKQELPPNPVIITIDDGYRDNYENAFPILQEYGLTATIFLATQFIDDNHPVYLTWDMIEEMAAAGIRFESHTKTHPDLRGQSRDTLIYQILGSQETIAAHIGYTPRFFSYPSGRYDDDTIQILHALDFWGAVTTWSGKWHGFNDRYEWSRLRVRNNTYLPEFVDLVDPGDTFQGKPAE